MTEGRAVRHPGELRWETRLLGMVTAVLVVFGIAATYGAASLVTVNGQNVGIGFAARQLTGAIIGGILLLLASRQDYYRWRRLAWPLLLLTVGLLIIPLLPFTTTISPLVNGARRWVDIGPVNFQPSELARLAVVIWCAMLASKKGQQIREFKRGVLPFIIVLGLVSLLIFLEPNLSMATLVALLGGLVLFTSGAKIGHFILLSGVGGDPGLPSDPRRPVPARPTGDVSQSRRRHDRGGIPDPPVARRHRLRRDPRHRASAQGQQKLGYLPYAYSDFLFSTIGEEWGFLGVLVVVSLFAVFCWLGFRIARTAADPFGQYLAVGLTATIGLTAFMHMAVSLGLMPDDRSHPAVHVVRAIEPGHLAARYRHSDQHRTPARTARAAEARQGRQGPREEMSAARPPAHPSHCRRRDRRASHARARDRGRAEAERPRHRAGPRRRTPRRRGPHPPEPRFPLSSPSVRADLSPHLVAKLPVADRRGQAAPRASRAVRAGAAGGGARDGWLRIGAGGLVGGAAGNPHRDSGAERLSRRRDSMARAARPPHLPRTARGTEAAFRPGRRPQVFDTGNPIAPPSARATTGSARVLRTRRYPTGGPGNRRKPGRARHQSGRRRLAGYRAVPADPALLWVTGRGTYEEFTRFHRPPDVRVIDFLDPMADGYAVPDLVVSRAGMLTVAELCAWGLPSILIPLPTAGGRPPDP